MFVYFIFTIVCNKRLKSLNGFNKKGNNIEYFNKHMLQVID